MNKSLSLPFVFLFLCMTVTIGAQSGNVVDKTVESIMQKVVDRDYEKAYSYVLFLAKIQGNTILSESAVLACEEAIDAYTQDLYSRREWHRLVEMSSELAGVPLSAQKKAEQRIANAKTELVNAEKRERALLSSRPADTAVKTAPPTPEKTENPELPSSAVSVERLEEAISTLGTEYANRHEEIRNSIYFLESSIENLKKILGAMFVFLVLVVGYVITLFVAGRFRVRNSGAVRAASAGSSYDADGDLASFIKTCREIGKRVDIHTGRKNNSRNVARIVRDLSLSSGHTDDEAQLFYAVALARDAGFLFLDTGLFSSGPVDDVVRSRFREHVGCAESVSFFAGEQFRSILEQGISEHHENLDGSGYPAGLKGVKVPFLARAIRVAESYDAMVSPRSYHDIRDSQSAIAELEQSPLVYDRKLVKLLADCV